MTSAQYAALLGLWIAGIVVPGPDIFVILRNAFLSSRPSAVFTALGVMVGNFAWIALSLMGVTVFISDNHVLKLAVQIGGALFLLRMGYGSLRSGLDGRAARRSSTLGPVLREPQDSGGAHPVQGGAPGRGPGGTGSAAQHPVAHDVAAEPARTGLATDPLRSDDAAVIAELSAGSRRGRFLGPEGLTPWRALAQGTVTNLANAKAVVFFVALFGSVVPAGILWWEALAVLGMMVAVGLAWFLAVAWAGSIPALARRFQARAAEVEIVSGVVFALVAVGLLVEALLTL